MTQSLYRPIDKNLWIERLMAIVVTIVVVISLFDFTYLAWRNVYVAKLPAVTQFYDRYKGIEPHRETKRYLDAVTQLKVTIAKTGLNSNQTKVWLDDLAELSVGMIHSNPFEIAHQSGHLEKIKNDFRDRIGNDSAKGAMRTFWSQAYLNKAGWEKESAWFDHQIRPLMATNYYRRLDESGNYIDRFWEIDRVFIGIFAIELLCRIIYLHRRVRGMTWQQAIIWRWYDLLLLLPLWQFLRAITAIIRLNQAELIDLNRIQTDLNQLFVSQLTQEISDAVVVQVLQQTQSAVKSGEVTKFIRTHIDRPLVDTNNINEVEEIVKFILEMIIYRIVPKIQPDLEAIVRHLCQQTLLESPAYRNLQLLPGIKGISGQTIDRIVSETSATIYTALAKTIADENTRKLIHHLANNLTHTLGTEMSREKGFGVLELLIADLIREIELTYNSKQED
jgi:hypothetical protein